MAPRGDGDIEWLLRRDDASEGHGYADFIDDKNMIVMGRGSHENALSFDKLEGDYVQIATNAEQYNAVKGRQNA